MGSQTFAMKAGAILDLRIYVLPGSYSFRIPGILKPCNSHGPCAGEAVLSHGWRERSTWLGRSCHADLAFVLCRMGWAAMRVLHLFHVGWVGCLVGNASLRPVRREIGQSRRKYFRRACIREKGGWAATWKLPIHGRCDRRRKVGVSALNPKPGRLSASGRYLPLVRSRG